MKFLPLFLLLFFILLTHAQRRTTAKPSTEPETPKPTTRGRGRSRFVFSPEYTKITDSSSTTESSSKKTIASRRRVVENVEPKFPSRATVLTNLPKQAVQRNADRTSPLGETADKFFLNDNVDRKTIRPISSASLSKESRKNPTPSTQTIGRKNFRTLNKRPKNTYEVEEIINDDVDSFRKPKKPRVLTETNFRASNFPKRPVDNTEPIKNSEQVIKNLATPEQTLSSANTPGNTNNNLIDEQPVDTTLKPEFEMLVDNLTAVESKEDGPRTLPASSTPKSTEAPKTQSNRRNGLRRVTNKVPEPVTPAPTLGRAKTRTRPTKAPDFYFQAVSTSVPSSAFRRRVDSLFSSIEPRKGPSVFNADSTSSESRSRTGRKIESPPEKVSLGIPTRNRRTTTSTQKTVASSSAPTFHSRGGSRFRAPKMPIIDEQKLEVLPLFEEEPKLVSTRTSKRGNNQNSRSRESHKVENLKSKADNARLSNRADVDSRFRSRVTFIEKSSSPKKEDIDARSRRRDASAENIKTSTEKDVIISKVNDGSSRVAVSISVETRTESFKPAQSNKTEIKESVTSEINEVTSRKKVPRKKVIVKLNDSKNKVVVFRGNKKSEVKLEGKQASEEIGESDNYPEAFKALLKAKKEKKESSASMFSPSAIPPAINVVTSSTPNTIAFQLTTREINENENELKPSSSTRNPPTSRTTKSRYLVSTSTEGNLEVPSERKQSFRSTSAAPLSRGTRNYRTFPSRGNSSTAKMERNVTFKSRTSASENEGRRFGRTRSTKQPPDSSLLSTKIPKFPTTVKKVDRGKYRSDLTTSVPKYIPTIPSLPYVPTVPTVTSPKTSVEAFLYPKDDDLGLQVISFDEPRFPIPSANLVNGDYNPSTTNSVSDPIPLVNGGTTEKPVSIIERIINSITAISTTSPATNTAKSTASTTESPSAILKLAPKRTRQTDKIDETKRQSNPTDTNTLTTENPTTIIEKILSSLNAIQATDNSGSTQVRTDFNTLNSFTTTPLSSVTKSSTGSLLAHSTTPNPLSILDEITPEEVLQKQTIGRLLDILNGLVVSTPQPSSNDLVVVTPKNVNRPSTIYNSHLSSTIQPTSTSLTAITSITEPISNNQLYSVTSIDVPSTDASSTEITSSDLPLTTAFSSTTLSTSLPLTSSSDSAVSPQIGLTEQITIVEENSTTTDFSMVTSNFDENLLTSSTTIESQSIDSSTVEPSSFPSSSEVGLENTEGINFFKLLSTLPTFQKFEVSPTSVSIFSANDLSNSITTEDNISTTTTVNIAGRFNYENAATTQSTTTEVETTTSVVTTEALIENSSGAMASSTPAFVNTTHTNSRSGKLLDIVQDPVQNSIDTSTPDYFIFAILNNNTVLRKKPLIEAKAPFFVIGVYPNNTVVKKYPNGTVVPMDSIIRVRGFDTRPNPPPLPEITSNQVTSESGSSMDSKLGETDEQNTIPSEPKPLSKTISTGRSITPQTTKVPSSSTTVTTPTTIPSKPETMSPLGPVGTLTTGHTVKTSTESTSTIIASNNDASTYLPDMVTVETSTVLSTMPDGNNIPTFPTLSELLQGKTLEAFNEIVNKTDKFTSETAPNTERTQIRKVDSTTSFNTLPNLASSTTQGSLPGKISLKTEATTQDSMLLSNRISGDITTTDPTTKFAQSRRLTSTPTPSSTYFPTFLTTLFPGVFETTRATSRRTPADVIRISAAPSVTETISAAANTTRPTTIIPTTIRIRTKSTSTTTTPKPTTAETNPTTFTTTTKRSTTTTRKPTTATTTTTMRPRSRTTRLTTTTTLPVTTTLQTITAASTTKRSVTITDLNTVEVTTPKILKIKELTQEQRDNLKIIAQLEKEQAELLKQLSFLTNLGIGPNKAKKPSNDRKPKSSSATLAERIVALAVERDKSTSTVESTIPTTTWKPPNSIQDQLAAFETTKQAKTPTSLDSVLKQLSLNDVKTITTPTVPTTTKSDDAILNSILKEQGFLPPTPKSLAGVFDETTIRPRPRPAVAPQPGPVMRGLGWLLNALAPQPNPVATKRPTNKPVKPKKPPIDQELLANSPTHVTPIITPAPSKMANALTQDDIQKLIKQLEGIQKDPVKGSLDLSRIKSIQNLINLDDDGVVIMANGEHGTTSRRTTTIPSTIQSRQPTERIPRKLSTNPPVLSVSNSLEDVDFESTTSRVLRAPIGFRPVPGVDDGNSDSLIRSNLITAAVNVTRAISGFLGTALQTVSQGAAASFSSIFGGSSLGTRLLGNAAAGSSAG